MTAAIPLDIASLMGPPETALLQEGFPSSSYTLSVEISYLIFWGLLSLLSVRELLLFSFGVVLLLLFGLVNEPGFNGVQLVKLGWLLMAAENMEVYCFVKSS